MASKRRLFHRPLGERRYKRLFVIAVEGTKTEPQYFALLSEQHSIVKIHCLKGSRSSPIGVLKRMQNYLKQESLQKSDEAWLVVDKDDWTENQLHQLLKWSKISDNYGMALSNPNFEYWMLLHFEDGHRIANGRECLIRLKKHLPDYEKGVDHHKVRREMILKAIKRAKERDKPPCTDWPRKCGTTVYRLVENILRKR